MVDTLVCFASFDASSTVWHKMIASKLPFPTWFARLQLAVAPVGHVLMLLYVRLPQTSWEKIASLS